MAASLAVEWAKKGVRVNCLRSAPVHLIMTIAILHSEVLHALGRPVRLDA